MLHRMPESPAIVLMLSAGTAAWYAMMIVHESGHVLAAGLSGGRVARVVLHPLEFSHTELASNPQPRFVAAAGLAWGAALPIAAWLIARATRAPHLFLWRFFAGFCLLANGAYLASAVALPVGDADDLLRRGVPRWTMVIVGLAAVSAGLRLWHGLGPRFGLGGQRVDRGAVVASAAAAAALVLFVVIWRVFA